MAVSTSEVGALNSTDNASTYDIPAFTPPANCLLTVFCGATATSDAGSTISDTGGVLTWTQRFADRTTPTFLCYTAPVGGSPTSITIRFDCTGDAATGCNMVCYATTGYDTTTPVPQAAVSATGAAGTTPAVTFGSARATTSATLGFVGNSTNPAGVTEPSGWTETEDVGHANPTTGAEAAFRDGGETGTTVTWGSTSASAWQAVAIEIAASTIASGDLSSTGTGAATASGASIASTAASSTGIGTAEASGASIASAAASSTGTSTAEAEGASLASAELNAIGTATAEAVGEEVAGGTIEAGAASSTGTATAEAEGASTAAAEANAAGEATAQAEGASTASAEALAQGEATAEAVGEAIAEEVEEEAPTVGAGGGGWYGGKKRKRRAIDDADMMILARLAVERILQDRAKRLH